MSFKLTDSLTAEVKSPSTQLFFRTLAYLFLLGNALFYLPVFHLLFGESSLLMSWNPGDTKVLNLAYLLDHQRHLTAPAAVLYLISIVLSIFGKGGILPRILVFVLGVMFYYAGLPAFNASFILYNLFAAFLVFMNPHAANPLGRAYTNLAFYACRMQFIMVYALTGGYKLAGTTWMEGSSVYYLLQLPHYTPDWVRGVLWNKRWLLVVLSYFGLIYQLAFPVLVWIRRLRMPLILAGVLFHGYIAIAMRLPEFGIGMIVAYSLFLSDGMAARVMLAFGRMNLLKRRNTSF